MWWGISKITPNRVTRLQEGKVWNILHTNVCTIFKNIQLLSGWKNILQNIPQLFLFIIYNLSTLLPCHHERSQIWNFAKMSKSLRDGEVQFWFFMHTNKSVKCTNLVLTIYCVQCTVHVPSLSLDCSKNCVVRCGEYLAAHFTTCPKSGKSSSKYGLSMKLCSFIINV